MTKLQTTSALTTDRTTARTTIHGLQVATSMHRFVEDQVLPGTGVSSAKFWAGFDQIVPTKDPFVFRRRKGI